MNPKISIITITFNSEKTVEETIKSVLSQKYDNLEYIIIDGASKDGTMDIVNKYRENISYIVSEPDNGISDAFNKGIKVATGEIIGIINSDDILLPDTLNTIVKNYSPTIDVYSLNVIIWDGIANVMVRELPSMRFKYKVGHHIAHQGRFIRKDAYEKYGFYDVRLKYMMDYDLLFRFYRKGLIFYHVNHDAALYRLGGTTSDNNTKKKNDLKITVMNNGGSFFTFLFMWYYGVIRECVKNCVIYCFGNKIRFRARYKSLEKEIRR